MTDGSEARLPELGLYQEPYWTGQEAGFVKSLLLFFDGVALLTPEVLRLMGEPWQSDPTLAEPLADLGLLRVLDPNDIVDETVVLALADLIQGVLPYVDGQSTGAHEDLARELVLGNVTGKPAYLLIQALNRAGYVETTPLDKISIAGALRAFVLSALGQLVRQPGERLGLSLQPVGLANRRSAYAGELLRLLSHKTLPTAGHVVVSDLQQVAFDLSSVPLDEVLDFRAQHGHAYRRYARDLRDFVRELAPLDPDDRADAFADRREALSDAAAALQRHARTAWVRPMASFSLGIAGAAVGVSTGNLVGAGISFAGGLLGLKRQAEPASAYSYLFAVQDEWPPPSRS